jgi:hypothetical protein
MTAVVFGSYLFYNQHKNNITRGFVLRNQEHIAPTNNMQNTVGRYQSLNDHKSKLGDKTWQLHVMEIKKF